ncbi:MULTISPECIES: hypothetical protein [unclassified Clostridium]|uniref:hypothetical protein n=1 Tax=unclassified Clostridium TaxID=2614128 RepID=UPI000297BE12|nr:MULTISPECIES: hypothetical protein [unclassified Clostridium]EKQ57532.1 MAG: hypothetical protein A370_00908 [Clostridium sp. Maddingley MBC34-26]
MKKLKSILIGASAAAISIIPSAAQIIKPERCSGSCGNCGFSCIGSVTTIALIGILTLVLKKIKEKCNWLNNLFRKKDRKN